MRLVNFPPLVFVLSFLTLCLSIRIGTSLRKKGRDMGEYGREDALLILGAILTLLGLIIGFSFSMAVSRYDQRKNYEEEEANAIGTEYARAGILPAAEAVKVRALLKRYLEQRLLFYNTRDRQQLPQIDASTAQLQNELWSAVVAPAAAEPTPVRALVLAGMNDVLNRQGYTQAAWWNRIPREAWFLMAAIAICGNLLLGYIARGCSPFILLILPLTLSIAFFLIADIESPRGGAVVVHPQNLESLSRSLRSQ